MQWYWYVLIGVGVIGLGILKVYLGNKFLKNRNKAKAESHKDKED